LQAGFCAVLLFLCTLPSQRWRSRFRLERKRAKKGRLTLSVILDEMYASLHLAGRLGVERVPI